MQFTASDVYEAWLTGQEAYRKEMKFYGIDIPKPFSWEKLPTLEKQKYAVIAEQLNQQLEAVREEESDAGVSHPL